VASNSGRDGKLIISTGKPFSETMKQSFKDDIPDHRILAIADFITKENPKRPTILISKDINLRMKAKSLGILSEDYKNDQIKDPHVFEKSITDIDGFSDKLIDTLYNEGSFPVTDEVKLPATPTANEYYILKGNKSSVLGRYDNASVRMVRVEKKTAYGIKPRNAEQTFSLNSLLDPEIKLVSPDRKSRNRENAAGAGRSAGTAQTFTNRSCLPGLLLPCPIKI